jgi:probable rRNA maturation factor
MSDFQIDISDRQSHMTVQHGRLRNVIECILREEGVTAAEISVALVDDSAIHRINRDYLQHDHPTDVITFVLDQSAEGSSRRYLDGELVLSTETAVREAPKHGWSPDDEVLLYVVHGVLHLCGYDDLTDEGRPVMRLRERQVLALWKLTPVGLEA